MSITPAPSARTSRPSSPIPRAAADHDNGLPEECGFALGGICDGCSAHGSSDPHSKITVAFRTASFELASIGIRAREFLQACHFSLPFVHPVVRRGESRRILRDELLHAQRPLPLGDLAPTNAGGRSLPAPPPWLPIIAKGKHNYDLEYQLPTEAP